MKKDRGEKRRRKKTKNRVSKLVFYAQSTGMIISGRYEEQKKERKKKKKKKKKKEAGGSVTVSRSINAKRYHLSLAKLIKLGGRGREEEGGVATYIISYKNPLWCVTCW